MNYLAEYQKAHGLVPDGKVGKQTAATMCEEFGIKPDHFPYFIAQIQHESQNFSRARENLNYGEKGLADNFKKYFHGDIAAYARRPEKIANRIYANRMGNGPESSGDGWEYRGGGALQLTGKDNYRAYFAYAGLGPNTNPAVLELPEHYFKSAVFFFNQNNLWAICESKTGDKVLRLSKAINLGNQYARGTPLGVNERVALSQGYIRTLV